MIPPLSSFSFVHKFFGGEEIEIYRTVNQIFLFLKYGHKLLREYFFVFVNAAAAKCFPLLFFVRDDGQPTTYL
jgi:hypothetical protein